MCDSKEQLIGFLYGELGPADTHAFRQHLSGCTECRGELADLRATRGQIAAWTPPEPDLGFQLVRGAASPPAPARVFRIAPAWGLAAAAILVIAIGAAVANLEVRIGSGEGLVIRTGWNRTAATGVATQSAAQAADVKQLDHRLREIEQALARDRSGPVPAAAAPGMTDEQVLQRVREMLGQSETRQQRMLAVRLSEIAREFDAQRRIDLAAIDQGITRLQNTRGAEVRQYRDMIQSMYRTASQQTK